MIGNNRIINNFSFFFYIPRNILAMNCIVKTGSYCKFACGKSHKSDGVFIHESIYVYHVIL